MIDPKKLKYLTTAAWLSGYADTLDEELYTPIAVEKMYEIAALLQQVWDDYAKENGYENTTA